MVHHVPNRLRDESERDAIGKPPPRQRRDELMTHADFEQWLERYRAAWATDDPQQIGALFTEDATYAPRPFGEPWTGRDSIVAQWIELGDSKNAWQFESEIVAVDGDTGVVRCLTTYPAHDSEPEEVYSNIWVVRLAPDGRARSFAEWWVQLPDRQAAQVVAR
jgi:Nuclear transport factor 2 (NTF2) domain.